jgi:cell division protein ZapA
MGVAQKEIADRKSITRVTVDILGDSYTIKGQAEPGYIADVARFVDTRMRELSHQGKSHSKTKLAVLTALNLADELFQLKRNGGDDTGSVSPGGSDELSRRTEQLITLLDEGLVGDTYYSE